MKVSVIIPCRNEKLYIKECIEAIFRSETSEDIQIYVTVVDGKSNDGTVEIVNELILKFQNLQLLVNEKQLTPYAFNLGIKSLEADFYQIIGARQIISKNYIQNGINQILKNSDIWCVGGKVENVYINKQSELISRAMGTSLGMGLGNFRIIEKSTFVDTVGTPLYPKHVFDKIGYFDEELVRNQDDEFNYRVTKAGGKILLNADISLKYYVRANINGLWRQFFQYGYWKVFVNKKHKAITTFRQLIPPLFVLYCCVFPLSIIFGKFVLLIAICPIIFYFVACVLFAQKSSKSIADIFQIFKIFPILHFSYGFGYLKGILDFVILKKAPDEKQQRLSR